MKFCEAFSFVDDQNVPSFNEIYQKLVKTENKEIAETKTKRIMAFWRHLFLTVPALRKCVENGLNENQKLALLKSQIKFPDQNNNLVLKTIFEFAEIPHDFFDLEK